jgi:3',5'-cyclic-AMP phosphodiesterase
VPNPTRRELLAGGLALGAAALTPVRREADRVLRVAHLTDIHVQPEKRGGEGMAACLQHIAKLDDRPDLILTGGDQVMDVWGADRARAQTQWDLYQKVWADNTDLPVRHCLGNHDYWNGGESAVDTSGKGYDWAMDALGMEKPYYAFDQAGWRFIVLQSTQPQAAGGYKGRLGEAQMAWLKAELGATPKERPILVLSHIPILAACTFFDGDNEKTDNWQVPGAWMHIDARAIKDLFAKHSNVKVCLSGHVHLVDRVDYLGVTYLCNGAVSGGWWGGNYQEFGPAYGLVDLFADGTCHLEMVDFGWQAG